MTTSGRYGRFPTPVAVRTTVSLAKLACAIGDTRVSVTIDLNSASAVDNPKGLQSSQPVRAMRDQCSVDFL